MEKLNQKPSENLLIIIFLARDARAFRDHLRQTQPDVDLNVILDSGEEVTVPIGLSFFWPDFGDGASN